MKKDTPPHDAAHSPSVLFDNAVEWIAYNDESGSEHALDAGRVKGLLSVALVADVFGCSRALVAKRVVRVRREK